MPQKIISGGQTADQGALDAAMTIIYWIGRENEEAVHWIMTEISLKERAAMANMTLDEVKGLYSGRDSGTPMRSCVL